jgi:hypothetical protein
MKRADGLWRQDARPPSIRSPLIYFDFAIPVTTVQNQHGGKDHPSSYAAKLLKLPANIGLYANKPTKLTSEWIYVTSYLKNQIIQALIGSDPVWEVRSR